MIQSRICTVFALFSCPLGPSTLTCAAEHGWIQGRFFFASPSDECKLRPHSKALPLNKGSIFWPCHSAGRQHRFQDAVWHLAKRGTHGIVTTMSPSQWCVYGTISP